MNQSYFINGFPNYRLVRLSESKFCVLSKKKNFWKEIGSEDEAGYISMYLSEKGVKKFTHIHVLVAEMFVPNSEGKSIVHHIDGDARNNNPSNLMWVTASQHRTIHNEMFNPMKGKTGKQNHFYGKHHTEETIKKLSKPVEQWSKDGKNLIAKYASAREASRQTKVSNGHICSCCKGKRKTAGGYVWRYAS